MSSGGSDLWYVKLQNGDVHRATLDQIEQAFEAGHVDGKTMVLATGETEWKTLGELAGLDDQPAEAAPAAAPPVVAPSAPVPAATPAAMPPQYAEVLQPRYAVVQPPASAPPAAYAGYGGQTMHLPVAAPVQARVPVQSVTPTPAFATSYAPPQPNSLRPVSMDFGGLDDDLPFRPSSRKRWGVALFAAAAMAGIAGVAVMRPGVRQAIMGARGTESAAAALPAPLPATPVIPEATPPEPPRAVPQPTVMADSPSNDSPLTPRFTDQQRQKLLTADKQRDDRTKARATDHVAGASAHGAPKMKSSGFTTGGNKFDPLNSSI